MPSIKGKTYLVTGGAGFIGAALSKRLLKEGARVRIFDDKSRGSMDSIADIVDKCEFVSGDVRDFDQVDSAVRGVDVVCHLAFVNGTEFFYTKPDLVLEVGVKGMINVMDSMKKNHVKELVLASSSEVYQTPPSVPTAEDVPLSVPDPRNPRYSYGSGKIISEMMALHYGRSFLDHVTIFRPHNVYGPGMGWEHVVPQFILRMMKINKDQQKNVLDFPIQGTGRETRAFIYIDDFTEALKLVIEKGEHLGIYHIGTSSEIEIGKLALLVGEAINKDVRVIPGELMKGGTPRRSPDINKILALGFNPSVSLKDGLKTTADWYIKNAPREPRSRKENIK